jgi:ZIP family zinc transporter
MSEVLASLAWGALAASSLVLGALLAFARSWPTKWVGFVLAFGAGALISAISFELAAEGARVGGLDTTAIGLAVGALTYYLLDGALARRSGGGRGRPGRSASSSAGPALALGAFLDGVPEQMALGIGLAAGEGVGVGLLVAIFVSNLPEAIGSATEMHAAGTSRRTIMRLWIAVAAICTAASVLGYAVADATGGNFKAIIDGFAAGALIVMLIDSMIPEATRESGRTAGLVTTLGFAVATALSTVS